MKIFNRISLVLIIMVLLVGCAPTRHVTDSFILPRFTEKGETMIGSGVAFEDNNVSFNAKGAHAVGNYLAIIGSALYVRRKQYDFDNPSYNDNIYTNGFYGNLGFGFFHRFKNKPYFIVENYLGSGYGNIDNRYSPGISNSKVSEQYKYLKYFNQTSLTYRTPSKFIVDISLAVRMSSINYVFLNTDGIMGNNVGNKNSIFFLMQNPNLYLFEPSISCRIGNGTYKGEVQINHTEVLYKKDTDYLFNPISISVGFVYMIKTKKTNK